jgi:hypothetical protein
MALVVDSGSVTVPTGNVLTEVVRLRRGVQPYRVRLSWSSEYGATVHVNGFSVGGYEGEWITIPAVLPGGDVTETVVVEASTTAPGGKSFSWLTEPHDEYPTEAE